MVAIFNNSRSVLTGHIDSVIYRIYLENTASVPRPFVLTTGYTDVCWGATTRDVETEKRMGKRARTRHDCLPEKIKYLLWGMDLNQKMQWT